MAGMTSLTRLESNMRKMSEVGQRAVYGSLTEQQQRALSQSGYNPMPEKGFLDGIPGVEQAWDVAAKATSLAMRPVGTVAKPVFGPALDLLTWIGDVPGHFYRAIRQMEGWQQWVALGVGAAAIGAAAAFSGGAALAVLPGMLGTLGMAGGIGLGAAAASTGVTSMLGQVQNPTEWWDMMNPFGQHGVGKGERIFQSHGKEQARNILGGAEHLHALARDISVETDLGELAEEFAGVRDATNQNVMVASIERVAKGLADAGTPEYQAIYAGLSKLIEQPEFLDAVDALQSSKISFGRDVAGAAQLTPGTGLHRLVSGSADALWLLAMDPLMAAGKAGKLAQIGRKGIEAPTGVDAITRLNRMVNEDVAVARVVEEVSRAVNNNNILEMPKLWKPLFDPMVEYKRGMEVAGQLRGPFQTEDFMKYIEHGDGLKRILEGKGTIKGIEQIVLSTQARTGGMGKYMEALKNFERGMSDPIFVDDAKRLAEKTMGKDNPVMHALPDVDSQSVNSVFEWRELGDEILETGSYKAGKAIGSGLLYVPGGRSFGNFVSGITTMIPTSKALALTGDDAVRDIPRFVEAMGRHMNMPSHMRDEWLMNIMGQGTIGQRRAAVASFTESIMMATGMQNTDELIKMSNTYIKKLNQAFAYGGDDVIKTVNGTDRVVGYLPESHQSVFMVMPDIREMSKIVRTGHFLKYMARVTDHNFAEYGMSRFIKPGWLLRIGFIPRAAGEEMLAFSMRMSQGGLMQEFIGRGAAQWDVYKEAQKKLLSTGNINELDDVLIEALKGPRMHFGFRTLERMGRRAGWVHPQNRFLDGYMDWQNNIRKSGIFSGRLGDNEWLDALPKYQQQLLFGKDQSVRRAVMAGVDPMLQEAAWDWARVSSRAIMEGTSAMNMSLMERSIVRPDLDTTWMSDPVTGERKEVFVKLTGERSLVGPSGSDNALGITDDRYTQGVYTQAVESLDDEIVGPIHARELTRLNPMGTPGKSFMTRKDVANIAQQTMVLDSRQSKVIVSEMLQPRPDTWNNVAEKLDHPSFIDIMEDMGRKQDYSIEGFSRRLSDEIEELKRLPTNDYSDQLIREAKAMEDRMIAIAPILDGLDALEPAHRAQVTAFMTRQMMEPDIQEIENIMRWADELDPRSAKMPRRKYYRGVSDGFTREIQPNGDLWLIPQEQNHWNNTKAVSMSTDPAQSAQFATRRGTADFNDGPAFDGGVIYEFDADYIDNMNNTTWDELLATPKTFEDTQYLGDGAYLMVKDGRATEIALATDKPVIIPAGKWNATGGDEYTQLITQAKLKAETANPVSRLETTIYDMPMEDIVPQVNESVDVFIASLSPDEKLLLRQAFADDANGFEQYMDQGIVNAQDYGEGVIADIIFNEDYAPLADPLAQSVLTKIQDFAKWETGGIPNGDLLIEMLRIRQDKMTALDDVFRSRLGMRGPQLRHNRNPYRPNPTFGTQKSRSDLDIWMAEGWADRGLGGFTDDVPELVWSPFHETYDDVRDATVAATAAELARPENVQYVRQSDHLLQGPNGQHTAAAPKDGVTRIYTPVVPMKSHKVDNLLNGHWQTQSDVQRTALVELSATLEGPANVRDVLAKAKVAYGDDLDNNEVATALWKALGEPNDVDPAIRITDEMRQVVREVLAKSSLQEDYSVLAQRLLEMDVPSHYADEFVDAMDYDDKVEVLADALRHYDASKGGYAQPVSQPLHTMAVDDPRVAKWISSIFGDTDQTARIGVVEVPFMATKDGVGHSGLKMIRDLEKRTNRNKKNAYVWELGEQYRGNIQPYDAPTFQHIPYEYKDPVTGKTLKGTDVVPGESVEAAMKAWAERITDASFMKQRRGVKQSAVFQGEEGTVGTMRNGKVTPMVKGEISNQPEDLFRLNPDGTVKSSFSKKDRAKGIEQPQWGNNTDFAHEADAMSDEFMWGIIGPKIRDVYEEPYGFTTRVPKSFVEPMRTAKGRLHYGQIPEADQTVVLSRSRVDDVGLEPEGALPNVTIAQNYKIVNEQIWERIVRYGFDKVIGPAIDSLARKPMTFHHYAQAYKQNMTNLHWLLNTELFQTDVRRAFSGALNVFEGEGRLSPEVAMEARKLAINLYDIDLAKFDDAEVAKWVMSLGEDQPSLTRNLEKIVKSQRQKAARRAAGMAPDGSDADEIARYVDRYADEMPEALMANSAEAVMNGSNRQALETNLPGPTLGKRTVEERLIRAYDEAIPEEVWEFAGREGVEEYIRLNTVGLPGDLTDEQWAVLTKARTQIHEATKTAKELAQVSAVDNMIPFLDSHEERSLFAEYGRNFLPFWYAEENFIKRWGRTIGNGKLAIPGTTKYIPSMGLEQLRKAQLTYMGIKNAGVIRTDSNGQDWVVYPGSTQLTWALGKVLPGNVEPIGVLFQARTDSLLPGVTPDGHVGPAPLAAVPVHFLAHMFPDAQGVKRSVLGDLGSTRGVVEQLIPTALRNSWRIAFGTEDSEQRYASAMMSAIAYAEAEGRGLLPGATAADMDEYLDRMRQHARIIMTAQMLVGFVAPGSPSAIATGEKGLLDVAPTGIEDPRAILSEKYRDYVDNLGVEEGTAAFLRNHENDGLEDIIAPLTFSTSMTESVSGAPLPSTQHGIGWYVDNKDWVDQMPEAGAWLIPGDQENAVFDQYSYQQQLVHGLRKRRTPQEYIQAVKFRQGADVYFRNKELYDEAVLSVGDDQQAKRDLDDKWSLWSGNFKAANPLFAEQLQSSDARIRRARTIEQLRYAVNDPSAPASPSMEAVTMLSKSYDEFATKMKILQGRRDAAAQEEKRDLKARFENWAEAWTLKYPEMERLWSSVYRPHARIDS